VPLSASQETNFLHVISYFGSTQKPISHRDFDNLMENVHLGDREGDGRITSGGML
jgi:hypothetical protein